jgi:hypothetical protein
MRLQSLKHLIEVIVAVARPTAIHIWFAPSPHWNQHYRPFMMLEQDRADDDTVVIDIQAADEDDSVTTEVGD